MTEHKMITTAQLHDILQQKQVFQFWNVLTDDYFTGEMIPGSQHVPLDQIGREVAAGSLPKDALMVVYCAGPSCPQSKMAADKLVHLGFTQVMFYEGGIEQWKQAGHPVASAQTA